MSRKPVGIFVPFEDRYSSTAVWPSGVPFPVPIADGESRFQMETRGRYGGISKLVGLAISQEFGEVGRPRTPEQSGITVHGVRSMGGLRESGYAMEGSVSIGGKKYSAFTSSTLFLVEGELVSVAVFHVRWHRPKPDRQAIMRMLAEPHGSCPRAGRCLEHEQDPRVPACR